MSAYVSNRDLEMARDVLNVAAELGDLRDVAANLGGLHDSAPRRAMAATFDAGRQTMVALAQELLAGVPE